MILFTFFDHNDNLVNTGIPLLEKIYNEHIKGMFDDQGNFKGFGFGDREKEPCQCYGASHTTCQSGDRMNIRQCLSNPECHWGPGQLERCANEQTEFQMNNHSGSTTSPDMTTGPEAGQECQCSGGANGECA